MRQLVFLLMLWLVLVGGDNSTDTNLEQKEQRASYRPGEPPCAARLAPVLEEMRRNDGHGREGGVLELRGVSLHQPLQGASTVDMYITDMKIKGLGHSHLERCRFTRGNASLSTKLIFGELLARGTVRLRDSSAFGVLDYLLEPLTCNMTMRMRYAPLEISVRGDPRPPRIGGQYVLKNTAQMSARFMPDADARTEFRGCEEPIMHRRNDNTLQGAMIRTPSRVRQMELAFLRGIREIMAMYMERQLRGSMTNALMSYMGYTLSYG